jgi:hypothetical protein
VRLILSGALSSNDLTELEGVLELGVSLSGVLEDERDLVGDLTTAIEMAGSLPVSLSLAGEFTSADPAGVLAMSISLAGALTTGIELAGALQISFSLGGLLKHTPSGILETVARPGEQYATAADETANRTGLTASRNSTEPRMVEA